MNSGGRKVCNCRRVQSNVPCHIPSLYVTLESRRAYKIIVTNWLCQCGSEHDYKCFFYKYISRFLLTHPEQRINYHEANI